MFDEERAKPVLICWPLGIFQRGQVWDTAEIVTDAGEWISHGNVFADRDKAKRQAIRDAMALRDCLTPAGKLRQVCSCGECGIDRESWTPECKSEA